MTDKQQEDDRKPETDWTGTGRTLTEDETRARLAEKYGYAKTQPTHEQIVRSRLGWIVAGVWIVAGAVILNMLIGFIVGAAATSY